MPRRFRTLSMVLSMPTPPGYGFGYWGLSRLNRGWPVLSLSPQLPVWNPPFYSLECVCLTRTRPSYASIVARSSPSLLTNSSASRNAALPTNPNAAKTAATPARPSKPAATVKSAGNSFRSGGDGGGGGGGGGHDGYGRGGGGGGGRGFNSGPRQMFPATCAQCGQQTEVPFKPSGNRPVYCRDCFQQQSPPAASDPRARKIDPNFLSKSPKNNWKKIRFFNDPAP